MFDRVEYKRIAKRQLQGRWATPVLATLSVMAVILIVNAPQIVESIKESADDGTQGISYGFNFGYGFSTENLIGLALIGISGILNLAYTKLFVDMWKTRDPVPFSAFTSAFSHWLKGVLSMFWMYLWVFLWSLLFFIPGIVKAYAYSQMFFIIAENPKIGVRKSMRLSLEITRGYKGDLFVMDMSFLGWIILSSLTGGLLLLYVMPYMQMAKTNAYKMLKSMAIQSGRVKPEDFGPQEQDGQAAPAQPEAYTGTDGNVTGGWDTSAAEDAEAHEAAPDTDSVIQLPPAGDDGTN